MFPSITEYNQTIQKFGGRAFAILKDLTFIPSRTVPVKIFNYGSGSYAVVFKAKDALNTYAIRCFLSVEQEAIGRYREISNYLNGIHHASWLVNFNFLDREINVNGQYYPVIQMDWVNGKLLNNYIDDVLQNNQLLTAFQREVVMVSRNLERNRIGHGDIQCGNMIIRSDALNRPVIKLIDYDGMYVPAFKDRINLEKGRAEFQHPQRTATDFNEKIDRFSFWVILCALEALKYDKSLWSEVMQGGYNTLDNMLFVGNDFTDFNNSKLVNRLYDLNQPSLSFYLDKLRKFCNSSSALVDESPSLFSTSILTPGPGPIFTSIPTTPIPSPRKEYIEKVEITSNPSGALVLTPDNQRIGTTPIQIEKQTYLNQKLKVVYGTSLKLIPIGEGDTIINVSFLQKPPTPPPPEPDSVEKPNDIFIFLIILTISFFIIVTFFVIYNEINKTKTEPQQEVSDTLSEKITDKLPATTNFSSDTSTLKSSIGEEQLKNLITDYYNYIKDDRYDQLNTVLAPILKKYFKEKNISRSEVIERTKKYNKQLGIISTDSKIRWNTFKVNRLSDGTYKIDYIEDYTLDRVDKTQPSLFVLHKYVEVNKDLQIQSIYEDIIEKLPLPLPAIPENWQRIYIKDIGSFDLPPTMEVQKGKYREFVDNLKKINGFDVSQLTAQQKGLNEFDKDGFERYARVMINTIYGKSGDYAKLNFDINELTAADINEIDLTYKNMLRNSSPSGFKIIEWYPLRVEKINGMSCFHISYKRQINTNPIVIVHMYIFQNDDRMYELTLSYRISESDFWASDFEKILKSFRIIDVK